MSLKAEFNEFKISVAGLERGMFVSRLDRPWLGTGFPLEGTRIGTLDDIQRLQRLCASVYVDVTRGASPDLRYVIFDDPLVRHASGQDEIDALRRREWAVTRHFGDELKPATEVHERLEQDVQSVMHDLKGGNGLDANRLAQGIDTMLESITRNPSALPWVMEMRRKGDYIYQHAIGSAVWAAVLGRHLGLEHADLRELALGALLCDVGKIKLDAGLLRKPPPLSESEFHQLRRHLAESCRIVSETPGLSSTVLEMVAHHHERHDGSGYPRGLRGPAIPIQARIAGLIDSYDAMTAERPYARARSPHEAVMELYETRDRLFQAELVEQFIRTCGIYPTGSLVELTDGSVGVVLSVNALKRLRPTVMLLLDPAKRPLPEFRVIDLAETYDDPQGRALNIRCSLPQDAYGINRNELFLD